MAGDVHRDGTLCPLFPMTHSTRRIRKLSPSTPATISDRNGQIGFRKSCFGIHPFSNASFTQASGNPKKNVSRM